MSRAPPASSSRRSNPVGGQQGQGRGGAISNGPGRNNGHHSIKIKLIYDREEFNLIGEKVTIGRHKSATIVLTDPMVSGLHCEIINGFIMDLGSTNGTTIRNGASVRSLKKGVQAHLSPGDEIVCGETKFKVERGEAATRSNDDLGKSKRFLNLNGPSSSNEGNNNNKENSNNNEDPNDPEAKMTVQELMDYEFGRIIGHDNIKASLRQFYKKVQLDTIRAQQGIDKDKKRLYHMIFSGPPGTGKTTMANVVAKVMLKMKLVQSDKVVFVSNPLELLAGYVGQTPAKVDAKVEEAKGGVLFIDEAYSILKEGAGGSGSGNSASFAKEAIDTIMKHLDPPTCVFIFAGYEKPMNDFLKMNEGLARRIPYRFVFEAYTIGQLVQIFLVMAQSKGEKLSDGLEPRLPLMLQALPELQLQTQNAGLISNWLSFAQIERDDRVDIDDAIENPLLASLLLLEDLENGLEKVRQMFLGGASSS